MATGDLITTKGANAALYRTYTPNASLSATLYLPPTKFKVGINNTTPAITDLNLVNPVPILDGTVIDTGANMLTGTLGGDNSTNQTTYVKEGAGIVDGIAQNLIANGSNIIKAWYKEPTTVAITNSKYIGFWLYIHDSVTYAKLNTSTWCVDLRVGSDATNYYEKLWYLADVHVGWNWLSPGIITAGMTTVGTPTGTLDYMAVLVRTNNAADTFIAGEVVYDLLRQWTASDLIQGYVTGYPAFDYTLNEVTIRAYLNSIQANGFNINAIGLFNEDATPLMTDESVIAENSKSSTDEYAFIIKNRIV
jgi:hypothetical protein